MSFYVTLQSNASLDIFPDNKISNFKNKLSNSVELRSGVYEVALVELSYTYGNAFLHRGELLLTCKLFNPAKKVLDIKEYHCPRDIRSEKELIELLNLWFPRSKVGIRDNIFWYQFRLKAGVTIEFSENLRDILGLDDTNLKVTNTLAEEGETVYKDEGTYPIFPNCGNTKLFIYTNIVRPQYVGDSLVPCLRVLNYDGEFRKQVRKEFIHPQFLDLAISQFDIIHIYILNESGEPIPFEFGNVTCTLRFRPKKL
jgi:hypothetical protein